MSDSRVHACLYFISPNGHGLKSIDIECMTRLHRKVNIIPVIGKADACTKEELVIFKKKIRDQLRQNNINVFNFLSNHEQSEAVTHSTSDDFPINDLDIYNEVNDNIPFAVVGSNTIVEDPVTGLKYRGRKYPWGCVNIEDEVILFSSVTTLRQFQSLF